VDLGPVSSQPDSVPTALCAASRDNLLSLASVFIIY
jgi:hypothetical protein